MADVHSAFEQLQHNEHSPSVEQPLIAWESLSQDSRPTLSPIKELMANLQKFLIDGKISNPSKIDSGDEEIEHDVLDKSDVESNMLKEGKPSLFTVFTHIVDFPFQFGRISP
jgi:hypothetical protein